MHKPTGSGRVDAETIAAFVDGTLAPDQRESVEAAMAADPETNQWVVNALRTSELLDQMPPGPSRGGSERTLKAGPPVLAMPAYRSRTARLAAGVALLAAAAALVLVVRTGGPWRGTSGGDARLATLVSAVGDDRYTEARFTGGFAHAPLRGVMRGSRDLSQENVALLAAAGAIQREANEHPTADTLHAWGVAQVLLARYDAGVGTLEHALAERQDDPRVMNDLAAALLARGQAMGTTEDWPRALSLSTEALARRPDLIEAAFNRALALERLGLLNEAVEAWEKVVALEADSAWSQEAGRHLDTLRSRLPQVESLHGFPPVDQPESELANLAAADPQQAREFTEGPLLSTWAAFVLTGRPGDADQVLGRIGTAASSLAGHGNRSLDEELRAIRAASGRRLQDFARAHRAFAHALTVYDGNQPGAAVEEFVSAGELFSRLNSPYGLWCRLHEIASRYARGEQTTALALAGQLAALPVVSSYPEIDARLSWVNGLFAAAAGRLQDALASYERASTLYGTLGERENATFLKTLTAEALDFVGDDARAWRFRVASIKGVLPARNPRRAHTVWTNAAIAALRQGYPAVAVALENEAVRFAGVHRQPFLAFEAYLYRARARASAGDVAGARSDLDAADTYFESVPAPLQPRMHTEVLVTRSLLPDADAGVLARTAADLLSQMGTNVRVPELLQRAAEARAAAGDPDGALEDLTRATEVAAALVPRAVENLRWAYTDSLWPLFRQTAMLQLSRGDVQGALHTAESGTMQGMSSIVDSPAWSLPPGTTAVRLLVGGSRSYAVVLTGRRSEAVTLTADADSLDLRVRQLRQLSAAHAGRTEVDVLLRSLGHDWVDPWIDRVPRGASIAIVPDGALFHVPFAALRTRDDRYLAEDHPVEVWGGLGAIAGPAGAGPARMVAVALEHFADSGPASLPDLANAHAEATQAAGYYAASVMLLDEQATPGAVATEMTGASVVHLATHALANPEFANLSWVAMAPDSKHPRGLWLADEIRNLDLHGTELVYLSACDGSAGVASRAEGAASLARAFLDAGAAAVVASSAVLDDRLAAALSQRFHEQYAANGNAALALNHAQRAMIADETWSTEPLGWASVQLFTRPRAPRSTS